MDSLGAFPRATRGHNGRGSVACDGTPTSRRRDHGDCGTREQTYPNQRQSPVVQGSHHLPLHVRAFYDSNADGIGDFRGLTEKLDYLQELGITAICCSHSTLAVEDDGYDIADYRKVHPDYGTLRDFRIFLARRTGGSSGLITELV